LLAKRNKALGLFNKVLKKLQAVHEEMNQAVASAHADISMHEDAIKNSQAAIEQNKSAIAYLENEKSKTLETSSKITALISG
jgi:Skp family chaperone for outer membrane proteins